MVLLAGFHWGVTVVVQGRFELVQVRALARARPHLKRKLPRELALQPGSFPYLELVQRYRVTWGHLVPPIVLALAKVCCRHQFACAVSWPLTLPLVPSLSFPATRSGQL